MAKAAKAETSLTCGSRFLTAAKSPWTARRVDSNGWLAFSIGDSSTVKNGPQERVVNGERFAFLTILCSSFGPRLLGSGVL